MRRRRFLRVSALGVLSASGGCTALGFDRGVPDWTTVATRHWRSFVLEDGAASEPRSGPEEPAISAAILADRETATERLRRDSPAAEFVDGTDFERSYLAVVEYFGMSSSKELALRSLERRESAVHVTVEVKTPGKFVTADLVPHSLVVRITEENGARPTKISTEFVTCRRIRCTDHP